MHLWRRPSRKRGLSMAVSRRALMIRSLRCSCCTGKPHRSQVQAMLPPAARRTGAWSVGCISVLLIRFRAAADSQRSFSSVSFISFSISSAVNNVITSAHLRFLLVYRESQHPCCYKIIKLAGSPSLPFTLEELEYDHADMTTNDVLKGIGLRGSI